MQQVIVSIEGNISSGKSTLIRRLQALCSRDFYFMLEPVEVWQGIKDSNGQNVLEAFYQQMHENAILFQQVVMSSRMNQIQMALREHRERDCLQERSLHSCVKVFGENLLNRGVINELQSNALQYIYNTYNEALDDQQVCHIFVYLRTEPEVCYSRLVKRGRPEEQGVSIEYLRDIHNAHQKWFESMQQSQYITIDGHLDYHINDSVLKEILSSIREKVLKTRCLLSDTIPDEREVELHVDIDDQENAAGDIMRKKCQQALLQLLDYNDIQYCKEGISLKAEGLSLDIRFMPYKQWESFSYSVPLGVLQQAVKNNSVIIWMLTDPNKFARRVVIKGFSFAEDVYRFGTQRASPWPMKQLTYGQSTRPIQELIHLLLGKKQCQPDLSVIY